MSDDQTAGPFGTSAEQLAIEAVHKRMQAQREHDSGLRVEALRQAINAVVQLDGGDQSITEIAEKYYQFLSGRS